jgi:surface protein
MDVSNVSDVYRMFRNCTNLKEIPNLNTSNVTKFGSTTSGDSWLDGCSNVEKIGVIDCDSATNVTRFFNWNGSTVKITEFGGCRNLGKVSSVSGTDGYYFMYDVPNLTYESVLNVLNGLYDRASAGLSVLTLKLHANHLAMLSEDDIAIATNKGWTIV